ncbi:MAG: DUF927 domain-containing protein [Methanotrichaceae archaeon]|jgi:hypothetical protein
MTISPEDLQWLQDRVAGYFTTKPNPTTEGAGEVIVAARGGSLKPSDAPLACQILTDAGEVLTPNLKMYYVESLKHVEQPSAAAVVEETKATEEVVKPGVSPDTDAKVNAETNPGHATADTKGDETDDAFMDRIVAESASNPGLPFRTENIERLAKIFSSDRERFELAVTELKKQKIGSVALRKEVEKTIKKLEDAARQKKRHARAEEFEAECNASAEERQVSRMTYAKLRADAENDGEPAIYEFEPFDEEPIEPVGVIGVYAVDGTVRKVATTEGMKFLKWISDCALFIHTETIAKDTTEFVFVGRGAKDDRPVKFTMLAADLAEPRKFKGELINAFGSKNKVGKLSFEDVQAASLATCKKMRIEVPCWMGNTPMLPGVGLSDGRVVEFDLIDQVPAEVYDGDIDLATEELRRLMQIHKFAPLVVCAAFAAPMIARWHPSRRFFLALWGSTGSFKTAMALVVLGIYGLKFTEEPLMKANKEGSTAVGAEEVFAASGFLPALYDNLKTTDPKNTANYIHIVHMVVEGGDKLRGKKEGGLRSGKDFSCLPIITGEIRPDEASTTARGLNIQWNRADADPKMLTEAQIHKDALPIIGYHYLRWLAKTELTLCPNFDVDRSKRVEELAAAGYDNPGRPATAVTLLDCAWKMLEDESSPFATVFKDYRKKFDEALNEVSIENAKTVTDESELAKFMRVVTQMIQSNPAIITGLSRVRPSAEDTPVGGRFGKTIGRVVTHTDTHNDKKVEVPDGIFLMPEWTLSEVKKTGVFNQVPNQPSLSAAMKAKDMLIPDPDGEHYMKVKSVNGVSSRGWLIKWDVFKFDRAE